MVFHCYTSVRPEGSQEGTSDERVCRDPWPGSGWESGKAAKPGYPQASQGSSRCYRQHHATLLLHSLGLTPLVCCGQLPCEGALGEKKPNARSSQARVIRSGHALLPSMRPGLAPVPPQQALKASNHLHEGGAGGVASLPQSTHLPSWVSGVHGLKAFPKRQGWGSFSLQQISNRFGRIVCA